MAMRRSLLRFTIRSLMIAVAVVAILLVVPLSVTLVIAFGLSYLALIARLWWMFRDFRRLSACCFLLVAAPSNIVCAALCIWALGPYGTILNFLVWLLAFPIMLSTGLAWAGAAPRRIARPRRSSWLAWPLILVVAFLPLSMLVTFWPFRLAFLASRPAMERLADRVAAGRPVIGPEWAGVFRVVGSVVDPASGNVGLVTDLNPSGRSGFVRAGAVLRPPAGRSSAPFVNLALDRRVSDLWSYVEED
jgi:hypothetical protein